MKGFVKQVAVLSLGALAFAAPVHAQAPSFFVGGGVGLPMGDFGDAFKTGFLATGGVNFKPASLPVGIQIDANFAQFSVDADADAKTRMMFATANAVYTFKTAASSKLHPYLIGGLGVYNSKLTGNDVLGDPDSQTKFGINAGAGFNVAAGGASLFVEGRFHDVFTKDSDLGTPNTQFVPLTIGLRFGGK